MKFGVMFANVGPMAHAEGAIGIAQAAEAGGIESLWTVEHTVVPAGYQSAYPYSDTGRMLEEEFDAIGVPFAERGKRTDDHIAALRALWAGDPATHHGQFSSFENVYSRPAPTQANIPIVVGGHSKAAARRAGRLGDGFFPGKGSHEDLAELIDIVRTTAVEHGREPDAIEITSGGGGALGGGALDEVKKLADLGVSRVIIPPLAFDVQGQKDAFARYGDEVISRC